MTTHENRDTTTNTTDSPAPPRWCCRGCRAMGPGPDAPLTCPVCRSLQVIDLTRPYVCPACGATSHHPGDAADGYCARCRSWTWLHLDERLLRTAVRAADIRYIETADTPMTETSRLRALIAGALRHLLSNGLLTLPDDLQERLAVLPTAVAPYTSWGPETSEAPPPAGGGA